jgi:hypothetical protein
MVMRTIEIREIRYKVGRKRVTAIADKLRKSYGHKLKVFYRGDTVGVRGDLRNYKLRAKILWIMSGGKHGSNVPAG